MCLQRDGIQGDLEVKSNRSGRLDNKQFKSSDFPETLTTHMSHIYHPFISLLRCFLM